MDNNCGNCGTGLVVLEGPPGEGCDFTVCPPLTIDKEGCTTKIGLDESALAAALCEETQAECGMLVAPYTPSGQPGQGGALTATTPVKITPTPGGAGQTISVDPDDMAAQLCAPMKASCGMLTSPSGAGGPLTGVAPIKVTPASGGGAQISVDSTDMAGQLCAPLKAECGMLTTPSGNGGPITGTAPISVTPKPGGGVQIGLDQGGMAEGLCADLKASCGMLTAENGAGGPIRGGSLIKVTPNAAGGVDVGLDIDALAAALCEPLKTKCGFGAGGGGTGGTTPTAPTLKYYEPLPYLSGQVGERLGASFRSNAPEGSTMVLYFRAWNADSTGASTMEWTTTFPTRDTYSSIPGWGWYGDNGDGSGPLWQWSTPVTPPDVGSSWIKITTPDGAVVESEHKYVRPGDQVPGN